MQQTNPSDSDTKETIVIGSIRLQERPYKVNVPVFEDIKVERPIFTDKQIEVPVGTEKLVDDLVGIITARIIDKIELILGARLDKAIDQRISEIKSPKIVEEVTIINKDVIVERAIYKDVEISRPIYIDKEILNPINKDVDVINAKIQDVTVINAIVVDQKLTNAIIKDVEVERAIIREKVIDVIHPRYLDLKGNPI